MSDLSEADLAYFAGIVAVLLAGDVEARLVNNGTHYAVSVRDEDGSRIVWGNSPGWWSCTVVKPNGDNRVTGYNDVDRLAADARPEIVAAWISSWDVGE